MIQIKIGQMFIPRESRIHPLAQKDLAKKNLKKTFKNLWQIKVLNTYILANMELIQDKLEFKIIIHNKYILNKENKSDK